MFRFRAITQHVYSTLTYQWLLFLLMHVFLEYKWLQDWRLLLACFASTVIVYSILANSKAVQ